MITIHNANYNWKPVKGCCQKKAVRCERCNNNTERFLAWDGNGYGIPGILTFSPVKIYAWKCPICPAYEDVEREVAKAIIKGGN